MRPTSWPSHRRPFRRRWVPQGRPLRFARPASRPAWSLSLLRRGVTGALLVLLGTGFGVVLTPPTGRPPVTLVAPTIHVVGAPEEPLPPVLQRIAWCESRGRHWTPTGRVVRGRQHAPDTGLFQINAAVWGHQAKVLGYDLETLEGNTAMARYLFAQYGSVPWRSSAACWNRVS